MIVIIISFNASYSQPVTWQRYYDFNYRDSEGIDLVETFDNNYMILCDNFLQNYSKISIVKLDYLGNVLENIIFPDSLNYYIPSSIQQSNDSGFTVSGYNDSRVFIMKINKIGLIQWLKYYNLPGGKSYCNSHKLTNDNGIIIIGTITYTSPFSSNTYVIKTDSIGNLQWQNEYNDSLFSSGSDVVEIRNNFYFTGRTFNNYPNSDIYSFAKKINSNGKLIWNTIFGKGKSGNKILFSNNNIFVSGSLDSIGLNMFLCRMDTMGIIIFLKNYINCNSGLTMCSTIDNKLILSGGAFYRIDSIYSTTVVGFTKLDLEGNILLNKQIIPAHGSYYSYANEIKTTSDNGFVFTGPTDFPKSSNDNLLVLKSDSIGNAPNLVGIQENFNSIANFYFLFQNFPNPFNSSTNIKYTLIKKSHVRIVVFDVLGRVIVQMVNRVESYGNHIVNYKPMELSSGIYYYSLILDKELVDTKRMVIVK